MTHTVLDNALYCTAMHNGFILRCVLQRLRTWWGQFANSVPRKQARFLYWFLVYACHFHFLALKDNTTAFASYLKGRTEPVEISDINDDLKRAQKLHCLTVEFHKVLYWTLSFSSYNLLILFIVILFRLGLNRIKFTLMMHSEFYFWSS